MIRFYYRSFPDTQTQTQNPSKIQRLDCGALVDFSEILKIASECIFWLEYLELQELAPVSEMPLWLVF